MRTLNNTEWGGRACLELDRQSEFPLTRARPPHSGFKMTACVLPKCPFRNKRKRSSRIDFTHRTFTEKGGMLKKARIQKKKVEPY